MGYVPPAMREKGMVPKKLAAPKFKTEQQKVLTKDELFEKLRTTNYGKADGAWFGNNGT